MVFELVLIAVGVGGLAYCLATYNREERILRRVIRQQARLSLIAAKRGDLATSHEYKRAELVATNQRIALLEKQARDQAAKAMARGNTRRANKFQAKAELLATQYIIVPPPYQIFIQQQQQQQQQQQAPFAQITPINSQVPSSSSSSPSSVHLVANLHPVALPVTSNAAYSFTTPSSSSSASPSSLTLPRPVGFYPSQSTGNGSVSSGEWGSHQYYALPANRESTSNNTPPNYQQAVYPNYAPFQAYPSIQ